jgi:hypothetical protein
LIVGGLLNEMFCFIPKFVKLWLQNYVLQSIIMNTDDSVI